MRDWGDWAVVGALGWGTLVRTAAYHCWSGTSFKIQQYQPQYLNKVGPPDRCCIADVSKHIHSFKHRELINTTGTGVMYARQSLPPVKAGLPIRPFMVTLWLPALKYGGDWSGQRVSKLSSCDTRKKTGSTEPSRSRVNCRWFNSRTVQLRKKLKDLCSFLGAIEQCLRRL